MTGIQRVTFFRVQSSPAPLNHRRTQKIFLTCSVHSESPFNSHTCTAEVPHATCSSWIIQCLCKYRSRGLRSSAVPRVRPGQVSLPLANGMNTSPKLKSSFCPLGGLVLLLTPLTVTSYVNVRFNVADIDFKTTDSLAQLIQTQ